MRTLPRLALVAFAVALLAAMFSVAGSAVAQTSSTAPLPTAPATSAALPTAPATSAALPTAPRPTAAGSAEGNSLPRPNSGAEPQASGDRGGWAQLVLMVLVFAAVAAVIGRIAWATAKRTRAKARGI
jgi:hypothetical protein